MFIDKMWISKHLELDLIQKVLQNETHEYTQSKTVKGILRCYSQKGINSKTLCRYRNYPCYKLLYRPVRRSMVYNAGLKLPLCDHDDDMQHDHSVLIMSFLLGINVPYDLHVS